MDQQPAKQELPEAVAVLGHVGYTIVNPQVVKPSWFFNRFTPLRAGL